MMIDKFENCLSEADTAARNGDWQTTFQALHQAEELRPDDAGVLTGLGTCLIKLDKLSEAIPYFMRVTTLAADSVEAHNNLGVVYALDQQYEKAEETYQSALKLNSDHVPTWKNLAQVYLQQEQRLAEGVQILGALINANPKDVEALQLLANCYEIGGDIGSAEKLFNQALVIEPNNIDIKNGLERLSQKKNEMQRIARPEHAKKLASLKALKKNEAGVSPITSSGAEAHVVKDSEGNSPALFPIDKKSIAIYAAMDSATYAAWGLPGDHQLPGGQKIELKTEFAPDDLENKFDFFVFVQPDRSVNFIQGVNACIQSAKPYGVYFDQDSLTLPADHPAYMQFGPGNPQAGSVIKIILKSAEWVVVPSAVLAERYRPYAKRIECNLPCWDMDNPLWEKASPSRTTLNIGWIGSLAEKPDLISIKAGLIKFLRENQNAMLVIVGDPGAYESFTAISEKRRIYLPALSGEDNPYLLMQFDILLVPARPNAFNQAKSDLLLLEAGVRRIPWIASPIPAFNEWAKGGLLAENPNNWYRALHDLAGSKDLRDRLGQEGRLKAESRATSSSKLM